MYESKCGMNPGSAEASEKGCKCSAKENRYGRGHHYVGGEPRFVIAAECPIHGFTKKGVEDAGKEK